MPALRKQKILSSYSYLFVYIFLFFSVIPHLMRCSTSYRAVTRYLGVLSAAIPAGPFPFAAPHWTPHRVRGDPVCSFFSTARRTNQEAPPLLSGFFARRLSPPSGAAELAVLKQSSPFFLGRLASSRPDKGGVCSALSLCGLTGPRHLVILRCDAVSRNIVCGTCPLPSLSGPRIVVRGDSYTGPRIECGVTRSASSAR